MIVRERITTQWLQTVVQVMQIWSDEVETDKVVCGDNIRFKLKVSGSNSPHLGLSYTNIHGIEKRIRL